jgi:hypothetical protein
MLKSPSVGTTLHRSIKITLDLYSHWIPDMDDLTADAMDDVL